MRGTNVNFFNLAESSQLACEQPTCASSRENVCLALAAPNSSLFADYRIQRHGRNT